MAIQLAGKFEKKTSDLVKAARKSKKFTNQDWDWTGVNQIEVYTLVDPVMGDYDATAAANRYGTPSEVQDTTQVWALTEDRSWSKVMDKKNKQDTMGVRQPGKYLAQSLKNVFVPELDTYIFATIGAAATTASRDTIVTAGATTSANAYTNLLTLDAEITDDEGPEEGRVAAMTAQYYNFLKQGGFILDSDSAYRDRKSGNLGTVDGKEVWIVPSNRLPANTDLIISHASVTVAPEKLEDYTLHKNAPGISGDLLEYRHRYDAFVDTNKTPSLAVHKTA